MKKYIDRILEIAEKHYDNFDALKREIESKIKNSECELIRYWIGTMDFYIPCVSIGSKKYLGVEIPRRVFHIWITKEPEDKITIEVIDIDTGEKRKNNTKAKLNPTPLLFLPFLGE